MEPLALPQLLTQILALSLLMLSSSDVIQARFVKAKTSEEKLKENDDGAVYDLRGVDTSKSSGDMDISKLTDLEMRQYLLQQISESVSSIEELEVISKWVQFRNSRSIEEHEEEIDLHRERRQTGRPCNFRIRQTRTVVGKCYYGFGNIPMCRQGDYMDFVSESACPRRRL